VVRFGNNTSATGNPQGCVLSPLLYSLFTHHSVAVHDSNTVIKVADNTTVVGLITDKDETVYREEVSDLAVCCQDNNQEKELMVDYRKWGAAYNPIHINGAVVERAITLLNS
jgi:hypothetical protein